MNDNIVVHVLIAWLAISCATALLWSAFRTWQKRGS
jgi:hypothetical protein